MNNKKLLSVTTLIGALLGASAVVHGQATTATQSAQAWDAADSLYEVAVPVT